jgi:sirohydrochlorin cobaltochelatase
LWRRRGEDPAWREAAFKVPDEVFAIKSPLALLADLSDQGYSSLAVQSLHVYAGEEYFNLQACIQALAGIKTIKPRHRPFNRLVLGRPALGAPGAFHRYTDDLAAAAEALAVDADLARENDAALVYMGHGNPFYSSGVYFELEAVLRRLYPDRRPTIGVVEGYPGLDRVMAELTRMGVGRVFLTPLLLTAGVHAVEDMAGEGPNSWRSILTRQGFSVTCQVRGLGAVDAWRRIYVNHLQEALANDQD